MKVKELIALLQQEDPEAIIYSGVDEDYGHYKEAIALEKYTARSYMTKKNYKVMTSGWGHYDINSPKETVLYLESE